MPAPIRLGTQGWSYDAWIGPFFPEGTKPAHALGLYARAFDTVEVDSTFYATPAPRIMRNWAGRVPRGFRFSLKLPQQITHEQRLVACEDLVALFADRARELGDMIGAILIQLGPDFSPAELPALAKFLPSLPRDLPFAIEFRDKRWITDDVLALLSEHRVALALVDGPWIPRKTMLKLALEPTADFAYMRLMGPDRAITDFSRTQVDRTKEIDAWVAVLPQVATRVNSVFGYVANHFAGHAPATIREMQTKLGIPVTQPGEMREQLSLL